MSVFVYPNFPEPGYRVRTARVDHRCSVWFTFCDGVIKVGEKYGVGEVDPDYAGGFGRRMYCRSCMAAADLLDDAYVQDAPSLPVGRYACALVQLDLDLSAVA